MTEKLYKVNFTEMVEDSRRHVEQIEAESLEVQKRAERTAARLTERLEEYRRYEQLPWYKKIFYHRPA
ncbi:MAG: hypothetical protein Q3965_02600 [Rothia sp. (in: high G+C Gram-positive bacteria)]|nr:hypothetical protein [Rothia sp. (in: high G+C Gram-positive bacteria)]